MREATLFFSGVLNDSVGNSGYTVWNQAVLCTTYIQFYKRYQYGNRL
jgi:hypothetical protein